MKSLPSLRHLPSPLSAPGQLRVLVKEAGSPKLTVGGADAFDETVVIAQMKGESAAAFAERAVERIETLGRSGKRLSAATLQTGLQHDDEVGAARRAIILALLGYDRRGDISEVLLEAITSKPNDHHHLLLLVDELLRLPQPAALPVRLRFREADDAMLEADSGVFWLPVKELGD